MASHKGSNTFVFKSFNELVNDIKITNQRRTEGYEELHEDESVSYFWSALMKWSDLNCTQQFISFRQEVESDVMSHVQVLHHQKKIVDILLRHLRIPQSTALSPLLDLVVQLGRDLQSDFYHLYFEEFFKIFIKLIESEHQNPEALKDIFMCLAFLFKFLFRPMVKDIFNVFILIHPLLSSIKYRPYINSFAAESFSFLMRKHKDHLHLFEFIFEQTKDDKSSVTGCSRLLFEMIKGIQKQFHSSAETVIPLLLSRVEWSCGLPMEIISLTFQQMASYTTAEHSTFIFRLLIEKLETLKRGWDSDPEHDRCHQQFHSILRLLKIWIEHKDGILITSYENLVEIIVSLLRGRLIPSESRLQVFAISSFLLTSKRIDLASHHRSRLLFSVFRSGFTTSELYEFTKSIFDLPLFEKDALLYLIEFLSDIEPSYEALTIVTSLLVHKLPSCDDFSNLCDLRPYLLDFKSKSKFSNWVTEKLIDFTTNSLESVSLHRLFALIYSLPHLRSIDSATSVDTLKKIIMKINDRVKESENKRGMNGFICVLKYATISLSYFVNSENLQNHLPSDLMIKLVSEFSENEDSLRIVNFILSSAEEENGKNQIISRESFDQIFAHLQSNLSSPFSQIRLLTLKILCHFYHETNAATSMNFFEICLQSEMISVSFADFREKLVHLNKLNQEYIANHLPPGITEKIPLNYLIGQLHIHFEPLWKHIFELIKSYALGMRIDEFWDVFGRQLNDVAQKITDASENYDSTESDSDKSSPPHSNNDDVHLLELFRLLDSQNFVRRNKDRPNFSSFREHLWTAMRCFPGVCEPRSRVFVPTFFNFMEKEYQRYSSSCSSDSSLMIQPTQDLRLTSSAKENKEEEEEEQEVDKTIDVAINEDEKTDCKDTESYLEEEKGGEKEGEKGGEKEGEERGGEVTMELETTATTDDRDLKERFLKDEVKKSGKVGTKEMDRLLVIHLNLFSLFHDPRSLYQGQKLYDLYFDLLKHQSPSVQKASFDCLMTYKLKYLSPYRENFERLISEKTFKNEVVLFSINSDSQIIRPEHRPDLIPLLMRILYGKMRFKLGKETSRSQNQARKNIILTFVANSDQNEIKIFLDLIFQPFNHFFAENDLVEKLREVTTSADISKVIPLRKQQGVLASVEIIFRKLGNLIDLYLPKILQLLVCLGGYTSAILQQRSDIAQKSVSLLKTVRNLVQTRINEFFAVFEKYAFSTDEIEAIFNAVVWPQIERLPSEGIHSPTPLLKLCQTWSTNSRYFCLLTKCRTSRPDVIVIPNVLRLLESKNVTKSVTDVVLEIVENLLAEEEKEAEEKDEEEDEEEKSPSIDPGSQWIMPKDEALSHGTSLVLLYLPFILPYLEQVVKDLGKGNSQTKQRSLPERELRILSKISLYVSDGKQCGQIGLQLLLVLAKNRKRNAETTIDSLKTVRNLVEKMTDPHQLINPLAQLFSSIDDHKSRLFLCQILSTLAERIEALKETASIIAKLNSWDSSSIDEPDYEGRMNGYLEATRVIRDKTSSRDEIFFIMIVHNCCYFLANVQDFSLRSKSFECLKEIILVSSESETSDVTVTMTTDADDNAVEDVVLKHLLPLIKINLKLKVDHLRKDFIEILGFMVERFPTSPQFLNLRCLRNKENEETDFFLNITHVQDHRRSRALRNLTSILHSGQSPLVHTSSLVSFVLPLVMAFLREEKFAKSFDILEAAVETFGSIARCLPWDNYRTVLQSSLKALLRGSQSTKLNVRILVAVLDNFHFDLRNSEFNSENSSKSIVVVDDDKNKNKIDDDDVEDVEMEVDEGTLVCASSHEDNNMNIVILAPGRATYIHRTILTKILPELHRCVTEKAKSDDVHKMASASKYAEDVEILRIPIAVAIVKLLKVLPQPALDRNLSGILLKVIRFLQSRSEDIRKITYDTLKEIVLSLGPFYLKYALGEMQMMLTRGYQLHVLCHAVWRILSCLQNKNEENLKQGKTPLIKSGDIDSCVKVITEICNKELFGNVAAEKEVDGIAGKLFEAKTTKSLETYGILAAFVSEKTTPILILSLREVLENARNYKAIGTMFLVLKKILRGLCDNEGLGLRFLMEFIQTLTSESLQAVTAATESSKDGGQMKRDPRLQPESCFLLKSEPPRGGKKPKLDPKANLYVLIEFGLQMLHMLLKRSKLLNSEKSHREMLDPFVKTLSDCLASKYVQVTSGALKCLTVVFTFKLPSLKNQMKPVSNHLFVLFHNYAVVGKGKGDNKEMVTWCFKAITALLHHRQDHRITNEQLHVLLSYVDQDLSDHTKNATAFPLLNAIITRKLDAKELPKIIIDLEIMSVRESEEVQSNCRKVVLSYLLHYPLKEKLLEKHVDFYLTQLSCDISSGVRSSLVMLESFLKEFPEDVICRWKLKFFLPLVQLLVDPDALHCHSLLLSLLKLFLNKLDGGMRDELVGHCIRWMQVDDPGTLMIGAMALVSIVEVEGESFQRHLDSVLPIIQMQIIPEKCNSVTGVLSRYLDLLLKIFTSCSVLRNSKWTLVMNSIWESLEGHLKNESQMIQLKVDQLFHKLFQSWNENELVERKTSKKRKNHQEEYPQIDLNSTLYTLCGSFCHQFSSPEISEELAVAILYNLVHLGKVLLLLSNSEDENKKSAEQTTTTTTSFNWLLKRLLREVKEEINKRKRESFIKRETVFNWLEVMSKHMGSEKISTYLQKILRPIIREESELDPNSDTKRTKMLNPNADKIRHLKTLCQQILETIESIVGREIYTSAYTTVRKRIMIGRQTRKSRRATLAVTDPEKFAKKKIKKNLTKKDSRKRRIQQHRPTKGIKQPKLS